MTIFDGSSIIAVMGTLTRKQREVRERELMLLDVARKMLVEQGYPGLSMDRLAEATEYSKGTIYQHFSTKEDLVAALAQQSMERRTVLFEKALRFDGRPRERLTALGMADELFVRLHPSYFRSELIIKLADLEGRASSERMGALQTLECRCFQNVRDIIDEAVTLGDLALAPGLSPSDVVFSMFTMSIGTHLVMVNFRPLLAQNGVTAPLDSLRLNIQIYLDGLGWKPLHSEWDYARTFDRISREVFSDEWRRVSAG